MKRISQNLKSNRLPELGMKGYTNWLFLFGLFLLAIAGVGLGCLFRSIFSGASH